VLAISGDLRRPESYRLSLLPTGAGEARALRHDGLTPEFLWLGGAAWLPDQRRVLFTARGRGLKRSCSYILDIEGGTATAVTPDGVFATAVSADGRRALAVDGQIYPLAGGSPQPIPGFVRGDVPVGWSADGASVFSFHQGGWDVEVLPAPVYQTDLKTGKKMLLRHVGPADPAGVRRIENVLVTPDGRHYVYTFARFASDLYLAEGLE
jgi:hypothetical protein